MAQSRAVSQTVRVRARLFTLSAAEGQPREILQTPGGRTNTRAIHDTYLIQRIKQLRRLREIIVAGTNRLTLG